MRRSTGSRIFAALWAIWFATALSEPAALHACAMHGLAHGVHAAQPQSGSSASAPVAPHAHAAKSGKAPGPTHADCTCIGGCCVAIAADGRDATIALIVPAAFLTATVMPAAAWGYRPTTPEYARPPSHAPPFLTA